MTQIAADVAHTFGGAFGNVLDLDMELLVELHEEARRINGGGGSS